jgi:uncharacterized FAD-dependent dehydrogenase
MQQQITLKVLPSEAADEAAIKKMLSAATGKKESTISGFQTLKKSIDARSKDIRVNLSLNVFIDEPFHSRPTSFFEFKDVTNAPKKVVIIGAGPAGLFAALRLIEKGIKPILLERGKDVRARRRDLAILNKEGKVNPESNYCFGEGGAGTYSDGKLYTRSNKRGDINRILNLFVQFGAEDKIAYEAHPHIGTNKLPQIITAMRQQITDCGGEFLFEKKVTDFIIEGDQLKKVKTADGNSFEADAFILATGHSARDIFTLLYNKQLLIEAKPFALGVRIEHPQELIDNIQYHCIKDEHLPPASYNLVQQVEDKGVFSFCMCPGGIIAPAATSPGELVVNGWSPSKRNNPFANSGMVVQVEMKDIISQTSNVKRENDPLALMHFQQSVEQAAFKMGGGKFVAPAQRMVDFVQNKRSASLPACSYLPGLNSVQLNEVLPDFIYHSLARAFKSFGKKMHGYYTNDAVVVATESRTSSPVRIPRDPETLTHPQLKNLYPCGEGAGYAGGIISAAMDGERVVNQLSSVSSYV